MRQGERLVVLEGDGTGVDEDVLGHRGHGAEYVVFGSYTQFGDGASLDLRCAPVVGGEADVPRRVFIQAGSASEIIPKLGVLAETITRYLVGAAASVAPAAGEDAIAPVAPGATSLADIEQRVEALERVIFAPPAAAESAVAE